VDSLDVIVSPFLLAESPVNVTATNAIWYEYDACQSVGINNDQHPSVAIKVFPDPASDEIQIVLQESLRKGRLMIKSNLGNTVLESDFTGNSKVLDVGNFRNGIYHIQVMDEMNVFSKKFMVVH
jgi:hypothetical protein